MNNALMKRLALIISVLCFSASHVSAQGWRDWNSGSDQRSNSQSQGGRQGSGGTPGQFDFYVLALSWSPSYCQGAGSRRSSNQCDAGKPYDFVVHGLWPQFERGFPSNCGPSGRNPTRAAMDKAAEIYPDQGLARHEWNKHGTCAGGSATDYFEDVAHARNKIVIPDMLRLPRETLHTTPIEIERAFTAANKGLRADMMSVQCNRNVLQEVRICFSKDLREFVTCPEVNRSGCRAREISVPSPR